LTFTEVRRPFLTSVLTTCSQYPRLFCLQDGLICKILDEYDDKDVAAGWFPRDLTAFDAEAQLNDVLPEDVIDHWHLGGDWMVKDDGTYDLSADDPLHDFPSVATLASMVSQERPRIAFSPHASADSLQTK
jgi:hypothetical protein